MTTTEQDETVERTNKLIESVRDVEDLALEAVLNLLEPVNGTFPDVNSEDEPRRKIIDSAFKMTEPMFGASTQLVDGVVRATSSAPNCAGGSSK
jgi:hypothetical protein